ncbi:MAG: hypothetical protein EHM18_00795 [Acidobacteria bacterium]|nr:MAG: hypothetical protein EHM18_00795 [Acidobacteriota bacterium]
MPRTIPPRTRYFYWAFACDATKTFSYHPLDMERFYRFIWAAHEGHSKLCESDVETHLISDGFSEEDAEHLANIYYHGRRLLKCKGVAHWNWKSASSESRPTRA